MKTLTISVEDDQYQTVVEFLHLLPSIEISDEPPLSDELLRRIKSIESGKAKFLTHDEVFDV